MMVMMVKQMDNKRDNVVPGGLSDRPLLNAVRAEIADLEHEAIKAKETQHFEAAVIYEVAAMRFRVMLQKMGFVDTQSQTFEHMDNVGKLELKLLRQAD